MPDTRRICVVTGARADYGLLHRLMREIADDPALELLVVATGMHLSPVFGMTVDAIEADGFQVDARVEMLLSSDTPVGVAKSMGLGLIGFADAFERLRPDIVVMLGDRFEILAAGQAALMARIPLAHIHGGEATQGALDESIRHSLTKMAHLHFTAAEPYYRRVVQMGEDPARVYNFGAPGLDYLDEMECISREELEGDLGMDLSGPLLLVTYHPATAAREDPIRTVTALLEALEVLPNPCVVVTGANADVSGGGIMPLFRAYADRRPRRAGVFASLGRRRYLGMLKLADVVVGNSSSGLHEAPSCGVPTVNIGMRQAGRLRATSVIDCKTDGASILAALEQALSPEFRAVASATISPYGSGGVSKRIKDALRDVDLDGILVKRFHDLDFPCPGASGTMEG